MAAAGLLGIIAGGPADTLARVQPLLDAIGARTFPAGPQPSSASLLKLTNNLVLACAIEAMGEAFSLVENSGADRQVLRDILPAAFFSCPAYVIYSPPLSIRPTKISGLTRTHPSQIENLALLRRG